MMENAWKIWETCVWKQPKDNKGPWVKYLSLPYMSSSKKYLKNSTGTHDFPRFDLSTRKQSKWIDAMLRIFHNDWFQQHKLHRVKSLATNLRLSQSIEKDIS